MQDAEDAADGTPPPAHSDASGAQLAVVGGPHECEETDDAIDTSMADANEDSAPPSSGTTEEVPVPGDDEPEPMDGIQESLGGEIVGIVGGDTEPEAGQSSTVNAPPQDLPVPMDGVEVQEPVDVEDVDMDNVHGEQAAVANASTQDIAMENLSMPEQPVQDSLNGTPTSSTTIIEEQHTDVVMEDNTAATLPNAASLASGQKRKMEDDDMQEEKSQKKPKAVIESKQQLVQKKANWFACRPIPGPNKRVIFQLVADKIMGYELVERLQPSNEPLINVDMSSTTIKPGSGRKRLWNDQRNNQRGFCSPQILQRAFDRFVQNELHTIWRDIRLVVEESATKAFPGTNRNASQGAQINSFQKAELDAFEKAFRFDQYVPDLGDAKRPKVFETYTGTWRRTPVTTFASFLKERSVRPSGSGPWSAYDGVQIMVEYLVLRLPLFLVSTNAVVLLLESCLSKILDHELDLRYLETGIGCEGRAPHQSILAKWKPPFLRQYSRGYATNLYYQVQNRLFMWMLRSVPAKMNLVSTITLHSWAQHVRALCRRLKSGQVQDVWRIMDSNGRVLAEWASNDAPKGPEELKAWFFAWLHHLVGPNLNRVSHNQEMKNCYLTGLQQQLDLEISNWLLDFPGDGQNKAPATRAQTKQQALDDIIRLASGQGRR